MIVLLLLLLLLSIFSTIGGFSKAFAMTGLRLGYAVCSDDRWIDRAIGKILGQVTGCPCNIIIFMLII